MSWRLSFRIGKVCLQLPFAREPPLLLKPRGHLAISGVRGRGICSRNLRGMSLQRSFLETDGLFFCAWSSTKASGAPHVLEDAGRLLQSSLPVQLFLSLLTFFVKLGVTGNKPTFTLRKLCLATGLKANVTTFLKQFLIVPGQTAYPFCPLKNQKQ